MSYRQALITTIEKWDRLTGQLKESYDLLVKYCGFCQKNIVREQVGCSKCEVYKLCKAFQIPMPEQEPLTLYQLTREHLEKAFNNAEKLRNQLLVRYRNLDDEQ